MGSFNDYGHMVVLGLQSDFFRFGGLSSSVCGGCNYSGNTSIYNLCSIKVILRVFLDLASDLLHCKQESFVQVPWSSGGGQPLVGIDTEKNPYIWLIFGFDY